jgi:multidrug efflux pump subunit AcrB
MSSETRANVVVISLGQRPDNPEKVDQEWDKLRAKLAEVVLPEGCLPPELQTDFGDVVTLLLAVTSPQERDYPILEGGADKLEDELKQVASVGRIRKLGAVPEKVRLQFSPDKVAGHGLSTLRIIEALKQHNLLVPGGTFETPTGSLPVQVSGEFHNERELLSATIGVNKEGQPIKLGDVLDVDRASEEPLPFHVDILRRSTCCDGSGPTAINYARRGNEARRNDRRFCAGRPVGNRPCAAAIRRRTRSPHHFRSAEVGGASDWALQRVLR